MGDQRDHRAIQGRPRDPALVAASGDSGETLTRATAASIMTLASSRERETGTSIRGRVANISLAGADCSCAVTAGGMSPVVTMKRIINRNASFDKSSFCCFIFFSFFGKAHSAELSKITVVVRASSR